MVRFCKGLDKKKGQALLVAMIFLLALTFLGFGLITLATIDIHSARNLRLAEEALTVAEQGALIGMAHASNPSSRFAYKDMGEGDTISGTIGTRFHYQTEITMGGPGPVPEGEMFEAEMSWAIIRVQSVGWVADTGTFSFAGSDKPTLQRRLEVLANIRVPI